jgi:hypothetical protein
MSTAKTRNWVKLSIVNNSGTYVLVNVWYLMQGIIEVGIMLKFTGFRRITTFDYTLTSLASLSTNGNLVDSYKILSVSGLKEKEWKMYSSLVLVSWDPESPRFVPRPDTGCI